MLLKCRRCRRIFREEEAKKEEGLRCPFCGYDIFSAVRLLEAARELQEEGEGEEAEEESVLEELDIDFIAPSASSREKALKKDEIPEL